MYWTDSCDFPFAYEEEVVTVVNVKIYRTVSGRKDLLMA